MQQIQKCNITAALGVLLTTTLLVRAENITLQQKLESEYALTSINAEGGIVTQGVTLTLKRGGLTASATYACANDYKGGKVVLVSKACGASRIYGGLRGLPGVGGYIPDAPQGTTLATRSFVRGEKFYISRITVADGITFSLTSDAIDNVTYKAEIRFKTQDLAQADSMVAEVFSVTRPDSQPGGQPVAAPTVAPPPPPPPPPPDTTPQTVSLGMSIDQAVAILGQPGSIGDFGSKKMYIYPQMKLTFVDGKLTDVQ